MGISDDIATRVATVKSIISSALTVTNSLIGAMGYTVNPDYVTAGQSANAAGSAPPAINVNKPDKPSRDEVLPANADAYSSGFEMPDAGEITDDDSARAELGWAEPVYTEWMLSDMKTKISTGFDDFALTVQMENDIFGRQNQRFVQAHTDAVTRRQTRWSMRGFTESPESLNAGLKEINTNCGYAYDDMLRDKRIKRAELKDDNRRAMIQAALKGEDIAIRKSEDIATRSLDAAESVVKLAIEAFKADAGKYQDVTVEQFRNNLLHYTEDLKIKIGRAKADIGRYSTNTRILSEKNRAKTLEFDADTDAFSADAYFNEAKADINARFNYISLEEMDANIDMKMAEIKANLNAFVEKAQIQTRYSDRMGDVYSQYLSGALESINVLLHAVASYETDIET